MLQLGLESKAAKEEIWIACKRDIIFWMDAFLWTFNAKEHIENPDRPFITWDFQVEAIKKLSDALGRHDTLIEKSRDMGASWSVLAVFLHRWLFFSGQSFLLGSRKEELVDGDGRSLMWKLDYALRNLPAWMVPSLNRIKCHLANEENGSSIDGEATNPDFGRGDRRTAILLDEFAAVSDGTAILAATRDTTNCRIFLATPEGAAGAYYDTRVKMAVEHPERIIRLHWSAHPIKAKGLYLVDGKPTSPWYQNECSRAAHPQEIAQELDIDYIAAAWQFFDQPVLDRLVTQHAMDPTFIGELDFDYDDIDPKWLESSAGRLQLWCPLSKDGEPPPGEYVIGCDVATGKGGEMSSQSVATVCEKNTGVMVAQFASNLIPPNDFGRYAVALAKFFHNAKLAWEANGPGGEFGVAALKTGYRSIYYRKDENSIDHKATKKPGWWSSVETKRTLLSRYKTALIDGKFINRCAASILECGQYAHQPGSSVIEHNRALQTSDPTAKAANHGDCVISAALTNLLLTSEIKDSKIKAEPIILPGSLAWRMQEDRKRRTEQAMY